MANLKDQLKADLTASMKARNDVETSTLRMALAAIMNAEVAGSEAVVLSDEQIALALSYVRREWGHNYPPVDPAVVKKARAATSTREEAWTVPELLRVQ